MKRIHGEFPTGVILVTWEIWVQVPGSYPAFREFSRTRTTYKTLLVNIIAALVVLLSNVRTMYEKALELKRTISKF